MAFLTETQKIILKSTWNHKRAQIPKEVPRRMKNAEHIKISDFKSYYKAKISKEYCAGIKTNT